MNTYEDYFDDEDFSDVATMPVVEKTPEQIVADKIAAAEWQAKNGAHEIKGDTYPVKDALRAIGCRWQSWGKFWQATGDTMFAAAQKIVADKLSADRAAAPANPTPLPQFSKTPGGEGEKITVEVEVEKTFDFESEFNRKKVVTTVVIAFDADGRKFKFNATDSMGQIKAGSNFKLTGTIKKIGEYQGEIFTNLLRCKIEGAKRIVADFTIELFCDAKSSQDQIAVCDRSGEVLEYGSAGLGRPDNGDNTDHELAGAMRALEIANEIRLAKSSKFCAVKLNFDAQWMKGMVGKAKPLRDFAKANNLIVEMNQISGVENLADVWTTASGSKKFSVN